MDPRGGPQRGPHRRAPRAGDPGPDRRAGRRGRAGGREGADRRGHPEPRTTWRRCSTWAWPGSCWARRPWRIRRWPPAAPAAGPARWRSGWTTWSEPTAWPRRRATGGTDGLGPDPARAAGAWAGEPIGAVVATSIARDGMLGGADLSGSAATAGVAAQRCPSSPRAGWARWTTCGRWPRCRGWARRWPASSWARPWSKGASAWRRRWPHAQRPSDPVPRRDRRPGGQGRPVRRPHRRGRPGRAGGPLRRRGRRRADLPRHHGLVRRPRHHGLGGGAHGRAGVHPAHRRRGGAETEDARRLLRAGADKVAVNTAAVERPALVRDIADEFGAQCAVVAIDARSRPAADGRWLAGLHPRGPAPDRSTWWPGPPSAPPTGPARSCSPPWTATAPRTGSISSLTRAVVDAVGIPVVASGGVGTLQHLVEGATGGRGRRRAGRVHLPSPGRSRWARPRPTWPRTGSTFDPSDQGLN